MSWHARFVHMKYNLLNAPFWNSMKDHIAKSDLGKLKILPGIKLY